MPRLHHVKRDRLAIERRKSGRGYGYYRADGTPVKEPSFRLRAMALGIPPAWIDVRIAEDPLAHIQAFGWDVSGRVQYIYHADWEVRRTRRKQKQLALLTAALPRIRRKVREDLEAAAGSKTLAMAIGIALIDRTGMRVGRERYLDSNGTRGAGTLFTRDVSVSGDAVSLSFPAKSGKRANYTIADPQLAAAIRRIKTIPGTRLLMYRDDNGHAKTLNTGQFSSYLRELAGVSVTAKDFRTLHGSALAGEALAKLQPATSASARKRQMTEVTRQVAAFLRNTPAICRKSYIAPCLFKLFDDGKLNLLWSTGGDGNHGLRAREVRLATVLASAG